MFQVAYSSSKSRKVQHGIRDLKITKWKCFLKAFVESTKNFCMTSSFALLRFAFKRKQHKLDKLLWASITITLTVLTIIFVQDFFIKFDKMSTKTLVKSHQRSTSIVNFPAVTVCATSSYTYSKVYGFFYAYIINNPNLREKVNLTKITKTFSIVDATQDDFEEMDIVLNAHNITMQDVFQYTAQGCDELLQRCRWEGKIRPCSQLFKKVFGAGNFCCSFNYPVSPSALITKDFLKTNYFGRGLGLSLVTRPIRDKFFLRSDYGKSIRIILHHFFSFPLLYENDVFAPMRKETNVEVDSVYNTADLKVRQLPIKSRDCVFGWERSLQHFPIYTYSNCILDCRISKIIRACGCATYFYPSVNASVCPPSKLICNVLNHNLDFKANEDGTVNIANCDCPDNCTLLKLHYSVQSTSLIRSNFSVDEFYDGVTEENGIVHINFSKSFTKLLLRKLILDEIELASSVGGIFALFLGCSLMSIFEVVYFLGIRMFSNYRRICLENGLVRVPMYLE